MGDYSFNYFLYYFFHFISFLRPRCRAIRRTPFITLVRNFSLKLDGHPGLSHVSHVDEDVVGRVTVKRSTEALLVEVVTDKTNAASKDEQTVQGSNLRRVRQMIATL